jgi:hypothetical protein
VLDVSKRAAGRFGKKHDYTAENNACITSLSHPSFHVRCSITVETFMLSSPDGQFSDTVLVAGCIPNLWPIGMARLHSPAVLFSVINA